MKKIDEKELNYLFNELKKQSQNAYNQLYEKYYKLVYGIAFSVMKNKEDSEDITNEVFTKIYKLDKEKLPVSNEASWLFTVTRNECFTYLRKSKQNISIDEIYEVPSTSQEIQEIIDTEYYNKLISGLSEQEKTIISLKILSNFTFSKIAQIMNLPIGTVQWKYYKAINSLKISIGSLAGAIVAFVLVFVKREKFSNKSYLKSDYSKESEKEINKNDITAEEYNIADECTESVNKEDLSSLNNNFSMIQTDIEPTTTNSKSYSNINAYNITLVTIGITLLIIFAIFFKKYQQKLHRKTSK